VKISRVQLIKNFAEIEVFAFLAKIQLLLHRQHPIRDFALRFFRHNWNPGSKEFKFKWVRISRQEER
jgi:hypothetical protein